ncbi:MAG: hypothetical protein IKB72_05730 [Ruminococcus sp.]|nr:hypothetical protein [Ruminococcus sp.]
MKKIYVPAEIEIFMFCEKQVLAASGIDTPATTAEHENSYLGFDEFI